ncbi:unnamed protein product, partial [Brassica oleracea var. botrytis]
HTSFYFSSSSSHLSLSLRKCFTVFSKSLYASTVTPHSSYLRMSESVAAEHDYIGLSMEAAQMSDNKTKTRDNNNKNDDVLNFKATELRLGLPGSESPERVDQRFLSLELMSSVRCQKGVFRRH